MIRFLVDVHVHSAITAGLRRRGVEVLTCQEAGLARTPDEEILGFAAENDWVVFSQDDDFLKLCALGRYRSTKAWFIVTSAIP